MCIRDRISDVQILATPEYFIGIVHLYILYFDVVHLAEHFGCVDRRIGHFQIVGIPQCLTPADIEKTTVDYKPCLLYTSDVYKRQVTQSVWGAVVTTIAVCLPSFILVLLISYFFVKCKDNKYIKAAMSGPVSYTHLDVSKRQSIQSSTYWKLRV